MRGHRYQLFPFQDGVICGMIGGTVAYALGEPVMLWALLSVLTGPLLILGATIALDRLPVTLPGRSAGAHEFAVFAALVAIAILAWRVIGQ